MKKLLPLLGLAVILLALLTPGAQADTDVSGAARIGFYYQTDGGGKNSPGVYDRLLAPRISDLTGGAHDSIYYDSGTDRYITGRGCGLLSHGHAWQFLLGKAAILDEKADVLFNLLKYRPIWSNTGSSLSPPNAEYIYADALVAQPGVSRYTHSLNSAAAVRSFFEGGRSCALVHVPNHFVLGIGCVERDGVLYIHIVDSAITATIHSGRLSRGLSVDFATVYTPDNALSYSGKVFEYYLPYSEFTRSGYTGPASFRAAFRADAVPARALIPQKDTLLLADGASEAITITNSGEELVYASSDTNVCRVSASGLVTFMGAGRAQITVREAASPQNSCLIEVYALSIDTVDTLVTGVGETPMPAYTGELPPNARFDLSGADTARVGASQVTMRLIDGYGDEVLRSPVTLAVIDPATTLALPRGLQTIDAEAFSAGKSEAIVIPAGVESIDARAFYGASPKLVFCADAHLVQGLFKSQPTIIVNPDIVYVWLSGRHG